MKSVDQIQDKPLECPVTHKGRTKFKIWLNRFGIIGFLFFLIKGIIWLAIFIFGVEFFKNIFE